MSENLVFSGKKHKIIYFTVKFLPKSHLIIDKFDSFCYLGKDIFFEL